MSDPNPPSEPRRPIEGWQPAAGHPTSPDQHDTAVFVRPPAGQAPPVPGAGVPQQGWYPPASQPDPSAAQWEARYRRQRTLTAVLGVGVGLALVAVLGLGVAAWQLARSNPLASVSQLISGDDRPLQQDGADGSPDSAEEGPADQDPIPLPEPLRELGETLGITDVEDLLALAVGTGLLSEEDADALRQVLEGGAALPELFGGAEG